MAGLGPSPGGAGPAVLGAPAADESPSGHLETVELSQLCHGAQVPGSDGRGRGAAHAELTGALRLPGASTPTAPRRRHRHAVSVRPQNLGQVFSLPLL